MDRNARVLLVDDNDDFRETVSTVLESRGYDVLGAAGGRAALEALDVGVLPDLILIDLAMPGMSGTELLRQLRRRGDVNPFGIIAMSGELSASASPAHWFLKKPLDMDLMLATVGEFCQSVHTARAWIRAPHPASARMWNAFFRARPA